MTAVLPVPWHVCGTTVLGAASSSPSGSRAAPHPGESPGHVYDRFMIWLTSLTTAVLIVGGLAAALLFVIGARLAVRALIPVTQRDSAHTIAAPLMTALGGLFALTIALTLATEAGLLASAQGIVSNEAAMRPAWPGRRPAPESTRRLFSQPCSAICERRGIMSGRAGPQPKATMPPPRTLWPTWRTSSEPRWPAPAWRPPRAASC
jgi:hypothetical protein